MPRVLFKPGQSGNPGGIPKDGRPKSPNGSKKKARLKVQEILDLLDFSPFEELVKIARTARSEKVRCEAIMDLCNYIAPKLRAVEITNESEQPFVINLNFLPSKKKLDFTQAEVNEDPKGIE